MMAFFLSKLGMSLVGSLVGVGALLGGFLWIKHHYTKQGYVKAITEMARKDEKAVKKGDTVEHEVALCFDRGGEFNVSTGECEGGK